MTAGKHLVIMAAGTGGHVIPGLAVAREMQQRGWSVSWLGTRAGMENKLVPPSGIPFQVKPRDGRCDFRATATPHDTMLVGLGDGSVRTVSDNISLTTWWQSCNPKDGNPLGSDW